ncbi:MFS transporter [Pseudonocardia kujensis]|uniref:MFS transporter n=1 Tax=Pseudonocardia kujensis TaxID=1128675 RepID=UPI001E501E9A|nr:MFS transporter [Pseudonocardia kujensis]MCE0767726.1 MFS transporter [Pseudonocardia kujensis]
MSDTSTYTSRSVRSRQQRRRWLVLLGSGIANAVGPAAVVFATIGTFVVPITAEHGWNRTTVTAAASVLSVGMAVAMPIVGRLLDRFAIRPILLTCWLGYVGCTALIATTPRNVVLFLLPYLFLGFFGSGAVIAFPKAVLSWYDNRRGLAVGILAGLGTLGGAATPVLAYAFISGVGWRAAYALLALISAVVAIPTILAFVRVRAERSVRGRLVDEVVVGDHKVRLELPGLTLRRALRGRHFWMIAAMIGLQGTAQGGLVVHLVPLMTDRGLSQLMAASLLTILAATSFFGRVAGGWLLDRVHVGVVGAVALAAPIAGLFLLAPPFGRAAAAVVFLGLAFGVESDLLNFLVSRYLGMRSFGQLLGVVWVVSLAGTALGPLLLGAGFDHFGSYDAVLPVVGLAFGLSALIILLLGRYPYPAVAGFDELAARDELAAAEVLSEVAEAKDRNVPPRS